jgi:transposase
MDRLMNPLNLPAFAILDTQQDEHDLHFFLETVSQPSLCPCCGSINGDLVGYGRDMQLFMDTPMHGKRVGLHINRRRMKCRDCNSTFLEPLADMHDDHRATKRLIEYIEKRVMLKETFARIAADVGLSEWTIRSIFDGSRKTTNLTRPSFSVLMKLISSAIIAVLLLMLKSG